MKTVICDICRKREAERCFKVKYKIRGWHRIDICKTSIVMRSLSRLGIRAKEERWRI